MKLLLLPLAAALACAQSFEVASIKPSPPASHGQGIFVGMRGGPFSGDPLRWSCENMSLYNLISVAYDLKSYEIDAPGWTQAATYNIAATLSAPVTREQFRVMLQRLLADRFGLTTRRERREAPGFELVVAKNGPKLKPGAPEPPNAEARAPGMPTLGPDGYPVLPPGQTAMASIRGRDRAQWLRHSMAQLASNLATQLRRPVSDATGLDGKYDISLYWVADTLREPPPGHSGDLAPTADFTGPNLFTALHEQLGLKLESKKVAFDVLVVVNALRAPTEN